MIYKDETSTIKRLRKGACEVCTIIDSNNTILNDSVGVINDLVHNFGRSISNIPPKDIPSCINCVFNTDEDTKKFIYDLFKESTIDI